MSARRWVPPVLAAAGLLAVAALASHGRPLTRSHGGGPTMTFYDYALTTGLLVVLAVVVVLVAALATMKRARRPGVRPRFSVVQMLLTFAFMLLLAWLVVHARLHHAHSTFEPGSPIGQHKAAAARPAPHRHGSVQLRWDEVAVAGILLAAAGVAVFAGTRRRGPRKAWAFGSHEDVALALDESVDDLRTDPDLRRAIIAAYARTERALAAVSLPRRPSEAPSEYLARALARLDASAPAITRLTELFERAKFSHHEPDPSMRDDAIDALVAVRDELRRPAEEAA
jgi:Domain of unknown function (DUF4129)